MGILNTDIATPQIDPAEVIAKQLMLDTKQTYERMLRSFNYGTELFWANPAGITPEQIVEKLGNDAAELFLLHSKLAELLWSIDRTKIIRSMQLIGQFTINEDGTVTIINAP